MNRDQKRNYKQYLEYYAESEARVLREYLNATSECLPQSRAFASIPLCRELELIEGCFNSIVHAAASAPAIVIFVVNNKASADVSLKHNNSETIKFLLRQIDPRLLDLQHFSENIFFGHVNPTLSILIVDRASPGFELPENQGVGLARKIGCDLAAVMISKNSASDCFIRNTDGDARVGEDFFTPIQDGPVAAIFPFRHEAKGDGIDAVLQYEEYLHYYVRAMAAAGSSYAFYTIGSTIACGLNAYISCRGFPKRDAGEDFYLLNKLAKCGEIVMLNRSPITLVARDSDRVPFGTGAACRRIEGLVLNGGTYKVYHPDCFIFLKIWLDFTSEFLTKWSEKTRAIETSKFVGDEWGAFRTSVKFIFPQISDEILEHLDHQLGLKVGLASVLTKSSRASVLSQHARIWFDGFRTMRFLNISRDHLFGDIAATEISNLFVD